MQVMQLVVGMIGTNCYFAINEKTKETLVIDPGDNGAELAKIAEENDLKIEAILLTHGHCDHTDGIAGLKDALPDFGPKVYALDAEKEMLMDPKLNQSAYMGYGHKTYPADEYLTDGQICTMAGLSFQVIATPGHTPGGCCFYFSDDRILFSGDSLFHASIGRTDFPGGSTELLLASIRQKLFTLPDETVVLPGHNDRTSIGEEKQYNPFLS